MNKKDIMQRLMAMSFAIMLMLPIGALADNVVNDVAANPGSDTFKAGESTTVGYKVVANNGDGQTGCNAADSSSAKVTINTPSGVTATPGSLTFTSCGNIQTVEFTSTTAGDYDISASVSDLGTGSYNINPAAFTLHVLASADTTAPMIDFHADETAEATSASGAIVNYESPATHDAVDSDGIATCSPASGSTFALGDTTVTCDATDAAGNPATQTSFKVHVVDTTPPTIIAPADVNKEATGPNTDVSLGTASATDLVDGSVSVNNDAPATFPVGVTLVTYTATDSHSNTATGTQKVTITDTTPPTIDAHADISAEASSSAGAVVNYFSPATHDAVDGVGTATCSLASDSTFAFGDTTVTCDATDAAGNPATQTSFKVHVVDTTPPTITAPADKTVIATGTLTSVDIGSPTVNDLVDPSPVVTNDAPEGFPIGTTLVIWKATDASGNSATATQTIKVVYKNDGILQPINKDGSSVFKQGSTIPVKFQLRYANGDYVSTATATIDVYRFSNGVVGTDLEQIVSTSAATTGNLFRYDSTSDQYIFNLGTKTLSAGSYQINIKINDGTSNTVIISLKK